MPRYTKEELHSIIDKEDIKFLRLQFTDVFGILKNITVMASKLDKIIEEGCMFDGSSIDGFARIEESDMMLVPDLDTFEIFPWSNPKGRTARFICDVYMPDGKPYAGCPRHILRRQLARAKEMGYTMDVGPECEFFLFHTDEDGLPTTLTHEQGGYFDVGPLDFGENARRDMVLTLEEMGFVIESSYHETAPAQHEIDFQFDEALVTADNIMTFRMVVKTIAKRHGLHATFMPKPKTETAGSGMHLNLSLHKDGKNSFRDDEDPNGISREAYYFMGGLMKHMQAITCITNPTVNSYKRLVPGFEAPVYRGWSASTRNPLLRIPLVRGEHARIELRSPDSSANPYLAFAVLLAAGLDGIRNQILPPEGIDRNIQAMTDEERARLQIEKLPANLGEAVRELEQDAYIREVLGQKLASDIIAARKQEYQDYCMQVTDWEIANYLYKV